MEVFQSRLESFAKPKRVKKPNTKSVTAAVKWPHPTSFIATPITLAEAGFFFSPSWEDRDNVTCFSCSKELSDWSEDDDPFEIHWSKCGSCPWAVVRCGLKYDMDGHGNFIFLSSTRLPSSKFMEKARLDTFTLMDWWPHDSVKNHSANSKKMAKAGFIYTPQSARDDTASCLYCNISLSGWDDDDDPLQEHRKREEKSGIPCPFFSAVPPLRKGRSLSEKPASESHASKITSVREKRKKRALEVQGGNLGDPDSLSKTPRRTTRSVSRSNHPEPTKGASKSNTRALSRSKTKTTMSAEVESSDVATRPASAGPLSEDSVFTSFSPEDLVVESESPGIKRAIPVLPVSSSRSSQVEVKSDSFASPESEPPSFPAAAPLGALGSLSPPPIEPIPQTPGGVGPAWQGVVPSPSVRNQVVNGLLDEEIEMTVEQWIKYEIILQQQQMQMDGMSRITLFKGRAREVRCKIATL